MRNVYTRDVIVKVHEIYWDDPNVGTFESYISRSVRAEETSAEGVSIFKTSKEYRNMKVYEQSGYHYKTHRQLC